MLIIDTAGRLQNKDELMAELEKIIRVIRKLDPTAPHTVLLTLDATTGQNALNQVEIFGKRAGVTGLVMTKLDGTARGGILVAIAAKYGLPVHFIGVGERRRRSRALHGRGFRPGAGGAMNMATAGDGRRRAGEAAPDIARPAPGGSRREAPGARRSVRPIGDRLARAHGRPRQPGQDAAAMVGRGARRRKVLSFGLIDRTFFWTWDDGVSNHYCQGAETMTRVITEEMRRFGHLV